MVTMKKIIFYSLILVSFNSFSQEDYEEQEIPPQEEREVEETVDQMSPEDFERMQQDSQSQGSEDSSEM